MNAIQVELGEMFPLSFVFILDGSVVMQRTRKNPWLVFDNEKEVRATIAEDKLYLSDGGEWPLEYVYGVAYKLSDVPTLKKWMQQLEFVYPL